MNLSDWLPIGVSILALIVSGIAIWQSSVLHNRLSAGEKIGTISEYLRDRYIDCEFTFKSDTGEAKSCTFRQAREQLGLQDSNVPIEVREQHLSKTLEDKQKLLEHRFAYEASISIDVLGTMILLGAVPLGPVATEVGHLILTDWAFCSRLVNHRIRQKDDPKPRKKRFRGVPYRRRHAEWLVYATALYLSKHWQGQELAQHIEALGKIEEIRKKECAIRRFDAPIIPKATNREIRRLLNNNCLIRRFLA